MSLETFLLSFEGSFPFSDFFKMPAEESIVENSVIRVFPKWMANSVNSANLINHQSKIWGQFEDHVCYLCLFGCAVTSCFLTQEAAGSNNLFLTIFSRF